MKSCNESILKKINIPKEGRLLLAFSGGEDSLFLLYVLSILARERSHALYINHNLRPEDEIEKEIALNRTNVEKLGVGFSVLTIEPDAIKNDAETRNIGVEAAARNARYALLEKYRSDNGYDFILTAHHRDDQTETFIMRALEHSPFWKWGGIREREGHIIRPMLFLDKSEIMNEVKRLGLEYSTDSTNSDTSYKRNYIRANILPLINEEERKYISKICANVAQFERKELKVKVSLPLYVSFSRLDYLSLSIKDRMDALYGVFNTLGERERLSRRYLEELDGRIEKGEKRVESDKYILYVSGDDVKCYSKIEDDFSVPYRGEETVLPYPLFLSFEKVDSLSLEIPRDILSSSIIRKTRKGDTIELVDGKRKISSLLKEFKIPYAIVIEQNGGVIAFLSSFLGGRDRLTYALKGRKGVKFSICQGRRE